MRDDMYKVIVERPRRGGITTHGSRRYRNDEDRPTKLGVRRGHASRKWLNENLAPLKRWLAAQAGRPWDGVYSDLCANIDRRNTVQAHIFAHIDGFVERHTLYAEARVWTRQYGRSRIVPIEESGADMYVHPHTGLLCMNHGRLTWNMRAVAARDVVRAELQARRRELTPTEQLHKLDGIWYRVVLAEIPAACEDCDSKESAAQIGGSFVWDAVRNRLVVRNPKHRSTEDSLYGRSLVYAKSKHQLSKAELRQHGLSNDDNAGTSRRCRLRRPDAKAARLPETFIRGNYMPIDDRHLPQAATAPASLPSLFVHLT